MTIDDATLMAYADGELDPITQKRVERALADDPVQAARAAAFGGLSDHVRTAFDPIATTPVPARLSGMLSGNVVAMTPKTRVARYWPTGLAAAAALVLGVGLGTRWDGAGQTPLTVRNGSLIAAGPLAQALDTQLASASGSVRVLVSFRAKTGYCRVFASAALDGIACRDGDAWRLRQTRSASVASTADYRQAASSDGALMAEAQDMMVGAPLDAQGETSARDAHWQ